MPEKDSKKANTPNLMIGCIIFFYAKWKKYTARTLWDMQHLTENVASLQISSLTKLSQKTGKLERDLKLG